VQSPGCQSSPFAYEVGEGVSHKRGLLSPPLAFRLSPHLRKLNRGLAMIPGYINLQLPLKSVFQQLPSFLQSLIHSLPSRFSTPSNFS
jgi:hypothetical protein